jgi:hypothetical protein
MFIDVLISADKISARESKRLSKPDTVTKPRQPRVGLSRGLTVSREVWFCF